MKRLLPLSILLLILSAISGYLFSKMSFIGRVGINLFYKHYTFLKTWWKGALAMFVVLFILMLIQNFIQKRMSSNKAILCHIVALLIAVIGIYFTYLDFQQYYAHRWLKEKFHLGGYLFWLAWICISLFFIGEKLKYREIDE